MKRVKLQREQLGIDLKPYVPNPREISEEITVPMTKEQRQYYIDREKQIIELRDKTINEKPCYHGTLQMLDVEKIQDNYGSWNLFDLPDQMEQYDLMRSIENVGLLNPIYCTVDNAGNYSVIIGRVRVIAYCNLFEQKGEQYRYIPSYVIPLDEIDELQMRSMMIESNICFRKISKFNMVRALIENYEAMKQMKQFRNEKNVGMEIAKLFQISEATTFNFLKIRDLCNKGLALMYDEKITLQVSTYLTKVPKETQEKIIDAYGVEGLRAIHKLNLLTKKKDITMEDLEKLMAKIEKLEPYMTTISIKVCQVLLDAFMKFLLEFKEKQASPQARIRGGRFSNLFKVKFNMAHMGYYLDAGRIDKVTLNKLIANSIKKMDAVK
ncbi:MAG: ParB N-terminal domain-containing protein [Oscillospiraceae bacterium]|nr:ParB N-terminal domain-containing protein [Oscillospiraceae bacterium]